MLPTQPTAAQYDLVSLSQPPASPLSEASSSSSSVPRSTVITALLSNPLFSAGAGIAGLGALYGVVRTGSRHAFRLLQKHYTISLEIPSKDKSYQWLLQYLTARASSSPDTPRSLLSSALSQHVGVETSYSVGKDGSVHSAFHFVPSTGSHTLLYRQRVILISREREKTMIDMHTGAPWETVTLRTFGRDRSVLVDLLNDARTSALKSSEGKTIIYTCDGVSWRPFGQPRKRRPLDSVILDKGITEMVVSDFLDFTQSQQWYVDRGIPYRRGYLLYGPPGCGKCWGAGTQLMLWSGKMKAVEDIVEGDLLMGDDSTPRRVLSGSLTSGTARMFRVNYQNGFGSWSCNEDHVLVLKLTQCPRLKQKSDKWRIVRWVRRPGSDEGSSVIRRRFMRPEFASREVAQQYLDKMCPSYESLIFECSVRDFMKNMSPRARRSCKMYQPEFVDFPANTETLQQRLCQIWNRPVNSWETMETAWTIGLSLVNSITTTFEINPMHADVKKRLESWRKQMECDASADAHSLEQIPLLLTRHTVSSRFEHIFCPLQILLEQYGVSAGGFVPHSLLTEQSDIRRALLAGMIDGAAHVGSDGRGYELSIRHPDFARDILHLCRGLGFVTELHNVNSQEFNSFRIVITGKELISLATFITRSDKRCATDAAAADSLDERCCDFDITEIDSGCYYGFMLDGNGRCLLENFHVTHNSSTIVALAGHMSYNICILNMAERGMTDDKLSFLLSTAPPRSIILLEDVDAAFIGRTSRDAATGASQQLSIHVTMSGLLNALDGVASTEERVIFMTTNYIERLDNALIRPGRVDQRVFVGYATVYQMSAMFRRFYPDADEQLVAQFISVMAVDSTTTSVAELQGLFLLCKGDARRCLEIAKQMTQNKLAGRAQDIFIPISPSNTYHISKSTLE